MDVTSLGYKFICNVCVLCIFLGFVFFSPPSIAVDNMNDLKFKCLWPQSSYAESIDSCSMLIQIDPNNSEAFFSRGRSKYFLHKFSEAIFDFSQVIILSPNDSRAYSFRGTLKAILEDYQGAIRDYTSVIELKPDESNAYQDRGEVKFSLNDYRGAIEDFNKAINLSDHYRGYFYRGWSKSALKDYRGAILDFTQAIINMEKLIAEPVENSPDLSLEANNNFKKLKQDLNVGVKKYLALAYRLRGICKVIIDEKNSGCLDLSKAGKIGDDESYDMIQKLCN